MIIHADLTLHWEQYDIYEVIVEVPAVWHLRHGASLYTVAKMVGHSNPTTIAKAYLPWIKGLAQATPKPGKGRKVVNIVR